MSDADMVRVDCGNADRRAAHRDVGVLHQVREHRVREPALADGRDHREDDERAAHDLHQAHALRAEAFAAPDIAEQPAQAIEHHGGEQHIEQENRKPVTLGELDGAARFPHRHRDVAVEHVRGERGLALAARGRLQGEVGGLAEHVAMQRSEMGIRRQRGIGDHQADDGHGAKPGCYLEDQEQPAEQLGQKRGGFLGFHGSALKDLSINNTSFIDKSKRALW